MKRNYKKTVIFILFLTLILLIILASVATKSVDTKKIKNNILSKIEHKTGSIVKTDGLSLSIFPSLKLVVRNVSIQDKNNRFRGNADSIYLYPRLIPLISKKLEISRITINSPDIYLRFEGWQESEESDITSGSILNTFKEKINYLESLYSSTANTSIKINNGRVNIDKYQGNIIRLADLDVDLHAGTNSYLRLSCNTEFSDSVNLNTELDREKKLFKGSASIKRFRLDEFSKLIEKPFNLNTGDSEIDLDLRINSYDLGSNNQKKLTGNLNGKFYSKGVISPKRPFPNTADFKSEFSINENEFHISVGQFKTVNPSIYLSGDLTIGSSPVYTQLRIVGHDIQVASALKVYKSIFNESRQGEKIFNIIKAGNIEFIEFKSKADNYRELLKKNNYKISGIMSEGTIYIPNLDWTINKVRGKAIIANETLEGTDLSGIHNNIHARNGKLKVGLSNNIDVFNLELDSGGNIKEIPVYIKQLVKNKKILDEIELFSDIEGTTSGKLKLGDKKSSVNISFDSSIQNFTANYERLPYPVHIKTGNIAYNRGNLKVKEFSGNIASSRFSDVSLNYNWNNQSDLELSVSDSDLSLNELYKYLNTHEMTNHYLGILNPLKGRMKVSDLVLRGPLQSPGEWNFNLSANGYLINQLKTNFNFNLKNENGTLVVNKLNLLDDYSDSEFKLDYNNGFKHIEFNGYLNNSSVDNIIRNNRYFDGSLQGNIALDLNDSGIKGIGKLKAENKYCGLNINGKLDLTPAHSDINFELKNDEKQLENTLECISSGSSPIKGEYKFKAEIDDSGDHNNLDKLINGKYSFISTDGTISRKEGVFSKILSILNISTIFKGKIGSLKDENMPYSEFKSEGTIENGKFIIKNAVMATPSFGILANGYIDPINNDLDLSLKVSPLESVDVVLRKIPLVKYLETKRIIFIPVHLGGWFGNTEVESPDQSSSVKEN